MDDIALIQAICRSLIDLHDYQTLKLLIKINKQFHRICYDFLKPYLNSFSGWKLYHDLSMVQLEKQYSKPLERESIIVERWLNLSESQRESWGKKPINPLSTYKNHFYPLMSATQKPSICYNPEFRKFLVIQATLTGENEGQILKNWIYVPLNEKDIWSNHRFD